MLVVVVVVAMSWFGEENRLGSSHAQGTPLSQDY